MLSTVFQSKPLLLLREAFISLLPVVLVTNILVMFSGLTELLESWGIVGAAAINGNELNRLYFFLIPLFINLSLSALLAKEKDLDQIGTILMAMVCFFRGTSFLGINESAEIVSYHGSILTSIPCTWLAVSLLHAFHQKSQLRLADETSELSPRLTKTLNLIIPGFLTVLCFEFIGQIVHQLGGVDFETLIAQIFPPLSNAIQQTSALQELIIYKVIASCTWFIGLHGEHSAAGVFHFLYEIPVGESASIQLKVFHNIFMNIGGTGSTFVIPLIVLFSNRAYFKKAGRFRFIAQLSLPFAFFNVNEILLFGLPILLNPIFFIPFFATSFVNMAIALSAIHIGLFAISEQSLHWMTPPIYNAYAISGGSLWAVMTQLICIGIDGLIYLPFLAIAAQQYKAPFSLLQLFGEDAHSFINEEINHRQERAFMARQKAMLANISSTQKVLNQLKGGQFILYFQPKVDAKTLELIGLEALLRFETKDKKILPPTFLPVLYEQGLSKVVDKKVVDIAFWQVLRWRANGLSVPPVAINFDKDFLLDPQAVQSFIQRTEQYDIRFCIEITEHTYTVEVEALASVVRQLRAAGHCISIDDFGAGYSSLTSLLALEADEIKLDRALVIAPDSEAKRGQILLASSIQLCHDLGFKVVAEGIETEAHLNLVQRCGVDVVQGYYLGKPMAPADVSKLFSKQAVAL
ncbi:MAG: EAL domain-containing protein [Cyanobacteria bacterium P01_D01_bin.105]